MRSGLAGLPTASSERILRLGGGMEEDPLSTAFGIGYALAASLLFWLMLALIAWRHWSR